MANFILLDFKKVKKKIKHTVKPELTTPQNSDRHWL